MVRRHPVDLLPLRSPRQSRLQGVSKDVGRLDHCDEEDQIADVRAAVSDADADQRVAPAGDLRDRGGLTDSSRPRSVRRGRATPVSEGIRVIPQLLPTATLITFVE